MIRRIIERLGFGRKVQAVDDVRVIRLRPGDVLVFTCQGRMPIEIVERLNQHVQQLFPGHKALVLDSGMTVEAFRKSDVA